MPQLPKIEERIVVPHDCGLRRLDVFLSRRFPEWSRAFVQRAVEGGQVHLNGAPCQPGDRIRPGCVITTAIDPPGSGMDPEPMEFQVLYEDGDLLAIAKPAGVVVHPGSGNLSGTIVNGLLARYPNPEFREMIDEMSRPGIVHRLDKDTSGVLVIAKNRVARDRLKEAFREHRVHKTYLAILAGYLDWKEGPACIDAQTLVRQEQTLLGENRLPPEGRIELQIGRDPRCPVKMSVWLVSAKDAVTEYRSLGQGGGCSLVQIRLHTGRTHQIRVHFSHFGHPVLGDALYGGVLDPMPCEAPRQLLHAWRLRLRHPVTGEPLTFQAPLPDDFKQAIDSLHIPRGD